MSSLKNLNKSRARSHRERSQPANRAHLGYLEKKKDYRERAWDQHQKERTIRSLKKKAKGRNPDEFNFGMVHFHKVDGIHQRREDATPELTDDKTMLMRSQDLRYVNLKRTAEQKKIEKLKESLHMLDCEDKPKNKHIVFVDSQKEVDKFDAAKHFNTHPALLGRTYNRPTCEMLKQGDFKAPADTDHMELLGKQREQKYKELTKRIKREKELGIIAEKLEMKRNLLKDKKLKKKQVKPETKKSAAVYKWEARRKR